jgi:hypothetical protein
MLAETVRPPTFYVEAFLSRILLQLFRSRPLPTEGAESQLRAVYQLS